MSDPGPWGSLPKPAPPAAPPKADNARLIVAVAVVLGMGGFIWLLTALFPRTLGGDDQGAVIRTVGCIALVAGGLTRLRGMPLGEVARNIGVWLLIAGVLAVGYAYRYEAADAGARVMASLSPGAAVPAGAQATVLTADRDGSFVVWGQVNGQRVRFIVDTGASDIVLSPADAQRVGIDIANLTFDHPYMTANGVGYGAQARVGSLEAGPLRLVDLPVSINRAPMDASLLGMAYLKRLASFEVAGDRITLRGKR